jgi:hypothetical protein
MWATQRVVDRLIEPVKQLVDGPLRLVLCLWNEVGGTMPASRSADFQMLRLM